MAQGPATEETIRNSASHTKGKAEMFIPAYYKIAEDLRARIFSGDFKLGDMLPSETEVCKEYNVSRMTARQGIRILTEEGLAESQRGKGSFVTSPKLNDLIITLPDDYFRSLGKENIRLLGVDIVEAGPEIAPVLSVSKEEKVLRIRKLHVTEGLPVAVDIRYICYRKGRPIVEKEIQYAAMPDVVASITEAAIKQNRLTISSVLLDNPTAEQLRGTPKDPALKIEQLVIGGNEQPLGYSITICHGQRFSMTAASKKFL